jgi:hypothetical protein
MICMRCALPRQGCSSRQRRSGLSDRWPQPSCARRTWVVTRVVFTLAGLPAYAVIAFYVFVTTVRVQFDYWPWYGHPDAGTFPGLWGVADVLIFAMLALSVLSSLVRAEVR